MISCSSWSFVTPNSSLKASLSFLLVSIHMQSMNWSVTPKISYGPPLRFGPYHNFGW
jgi:hypothetical protein